MLSACGSSTDPIVVPHPAPTSTLDAVGAKEDKLEGRIAAAVQTAQAHADNPAIVKAETSVALAGLPKPSTGDLAYAEARALNANPAVYKSDAAWMLKSANEIDKMWDGMEAEKKKNLEAMSKMAGEIDTLRKQVDQAKRDIWTYLGGGMVFLGALSLAFASKKGGAWLMLGGFGCGAFSMLLGTPWFIPAVGGLAIVGGLLCYAHFLRKPPATDEAPKDQAA